MTQRATKLVIITEKVLLRELGQLVQRAGASGYTLTSAGGVGSRNIRSSGQPTVSDTYSNIRIEVITASEELARSIAKQVADRYFANYSGIAYLDEVEVLFAHNL